MQEKLVIANCELADKNWKARASGIGGLKVSYHSPVFTPRCLVEAAELS